MGSESGHLRAVDRPAGPSDASLISAALAGSQSAYEGLVERYKNSLYRLAISILGRPQDAEDAVQEAFIKAYLNLGSFRPEYAFYTWISTILSNVCYSALRARDWQVSRLPDGVLHPQRLSEPNDDPAIAALVRSRDETLRAAMHSLPRKYARVLVLRYWRDLSYQEVAEVTGQSMAAVKTQIHRAHLLLGQRIVAQRMDLAPEAG